MKLTLQFEVETNDAGDMCAPTCPWLSVEGYCNLFGCWIGTDADYLVRYRLSGCAAHEVGETVDAGKAIEAGLRKLLETCSYEEIKGIKRAISFLGEMELT